ncbi:MAG: DUF3887 domain-containing protein [Armatimonadota bacterium]
MKKSIWLVILMIYVVAAITGCGGKSNAIIAVDCINSMAKGDFASVTANFDSTMKTALPDDKLKETWTLVTGQVGAFKGTGDPLVSKDGENDVVTVPCNFEKISVNAKFVFNKSKEISGFWITP